MKYHGNSCLLYAMFFFNLTGPYIRTTSLFTQALNRLCLPLCWVNMLVVLNIGLWMVLLNMKNMIYMYMMNFGNTRPYD